MSTPAIEDLLVTTTDTLEAVMRCIDRSGRIGLALLVDDDRRLIATITDGDIRRGLLAGLTLDATDRPPSSRSRRACRIPRR